MTATIRALCRLMWINKRKEEKGRVDEPVFDNDDDLVFTAICKFLKVLDLLFFFGFLDSFSELISFLLIFVFHNET